MNPKKLKVVIYALTTVFSKGVAQLLANKLISSAFGPAGLGLYGIWQNLSQIVVSFSNGSINNGIIVATSNVSEDQEGLKKVASSALIISLITSLILSIALIALFPYIKSHFFSGNISHFSILVLALSLPVIAWSICLSNILNGLQSTNDQLITNILIPTSYIGLIYLAVSSDNLNYAYISLTCSQILPFFILVYFVKKRVGFWPFPKPRFTSQSKTFLSYSLMSVAFTLSFPFATFIIRQNLLDHGSIEMTGLYDSVFRISSISSSIISAVVSVYFLPTIAKTEAAKVISKYHFAYKHLLAIYVIGVLCALFFSEKVILILYSEKFIAVSGLIWIQILGDLFKTVSFLNMNFFVSRNFVRTFILLELSIAIFYLSLCFTTGFKELNGIIISYALTYFIYSIVSYLFLKYRVRIA